jgi:beta-phosphoglucomutase
MRNHYDFPGLGRLDASSGLAFIDASSDGAFREGANGVGAVARTGDRKVELVGLPGATLAYVSSELGYPAYYPVPALEPERPIAALLMDLDGTTVRSEAFWIGAIRKAMARVSGRRGFELEEADLPFVSGHSVSEHLSYCIRKYLPGTRLEAARDAYFDVVDFEMGEILEGRGEVDAFSPAPGLKDFLLEVKSRAIRIALVTSGLYRKAYPEILSAFRSLGMGDPKDFYDAIISAGFPLGRGEVGTMGELCPKPHPWLYAEVARVGLGIGPGARGAVLGVEDSGAGICSVRLAGFAPVGVEGGNIRESGTAGLCSAICGGLEELLGLIDERGKA